MKGKSMEKSNTTKGAVLKLKNLWGKEVRKGPFKLIDETGYSEHGQEG